MNIKIKDTKEIQAEIKNKIDECVSFLEKCNEDELIGRLYSLEAKIQNDDMKSGLELSILTYIMHECVEGIE